MRKIGFMGGSFHPIHVRHVEMAEEAFQSMQLDEIIFLPSGNPPHKRIGYESAEDRFAMVQLAITGKEGMSASRIEIDRGGIIYTADSLILLKNRMPDTKFYYIIGEDTLYDLPNWHTPDAVFSLTEFIVCLRPGQDGNPYSFAKGLEKRGARFHFLTLAEEDISSTHVREELLVNGFSHDLHPAVMGYILCAGIYGLQPLVDDFHKRFDELVRLLKPTRLMHTFSVVEFSVSLARQYGIAEKKAAQAAFFHDCAKYLSLEDMLSLTSGMVLDDEMRHSTDLLHAAAGAELARTMFSVTDEDVLEAIRYHTTGRVGMTRLEMILFLADKLERTRKPYPGLYDMQILAHESLEKAMLRSLSSTLDYVNAKGFPVYSLTGEVFSWLKSVNEKEQRL